MSRRFLAPAAWISASALCLAAAIASARQAQEPPPSPPPTTQPAEPTAPAPIPDEAQLIRDLLRSREKTAPLSPQEPGSPAQTLAPTTQPATDDPGLLPDGTLIVERQGRLIWEDGKPLFVSLLPQTGESETLALLPNRLLEAMEAAAEHTESQFIISAEVTLYRGRNFLLLRKVLRRVEHGNLGP